MKIAFISTRFVKGGVTNLICDIVNGLCFSYLPDESEQKEISQLNNKIEIILITGKENIDKVKFSQLRKKIKIYLIDELQREINPIKDFLALFKIINILIKEKIDIVHTHSSKAGIIGRLSGLLCGIKKTIHSPHGHIFNENANIPSVSSSKIKLKIFLILERIFALITKKIIVITERDFKDHLKLKIGNENKLKLIYNGIDVEKFQKKDLQKREEFLKNNNIKEDSIIVGTLSRIEQEKGIEILIELGLKLDNRFIILIAGEGTLKNEFEEKIRSANLENKIFLLNEYEKPEEFYNLIDIYFMTSYYEGFGLTVIEALASGCKLIGFKTGILNDINGFENIIKILQDRDIEKIEKEIKTLAETIASIDEHRHLFLYLKENFDIKKIIINYKKLYNKI